MSAALACILAHVYTIISTARLVNWVTIVAGNAGVSRQISLKCLGPSRLAYCLHWPEWRHDISRYALLLRCCDHQYSLTCWQDYTISPRTLFWLDSASQTMHLRIVVSGPRARKGGLPLVGGLQYCTTHNLWQLHCVLQISEPKLPTPDPP